MATRRWLMIGAGAGASVTTIVVLFAILTMKYGFIITDITGDVYCEGTYEHPCISEFTVRNPNNFSVDIYNKEQVKLSFSPEIADYALFVPDGRCSATGKCACVLESGRKLGFKGWRCVDFTNATKPIADKAYNFRFDAYSTTMFRIAGMKNSPFDRVKWGIGMEGGELDPVWEPMNYTYRRSINISNNILPYVYLNNSACVTINDTCQYIAAPSNANYIYYNDSVTYAIYSGSSKTITDVAFGNVTPSVYGTYGSNVLFYSHMENKSAWDVGPYKIRATDFSVPVVPGVIGNAILLNYNITGGYFYYGDPVQLDGMANLTFVAAIKPISDTISGWPISKFNGGSAAGYSWGIMVNGAGTRVISCVVATSTYCQVDSTAASKQGNLTYRVGCVYDGNLHIYLNGTLNASTVCSTHGVVQATTTKFLIGAEGRSTPGSFFPGTIDEVLVMNESWNASMMAADFNNTMTNTGYVVLGAEETNATAPDTYPPDLNITLPNANNTYTQNESYVFVNVSADENIGGCLLTPSGIQYNYTFENLTIKLNETELSGIIYIELPKRARVTSAIGTVRGYNSTVKHTNAEEYTTSDGWWDAFEHGSDKIHDGSYITWGQSLDDTTANLTGVWQMSYGNATLIFSMYAAGEVPTSNTTVPDECKIQNAVNMTMTGWDVAATKGFNITCLNSTGYVKLYDSPSPISQPRMYEDDMYFVYYPENVTIDIGNDSSSDFTNTTSFRTYQSIDLNITAINDYINDVCTSNIVYENCFVPINVSSSSAGRIYITDIVINFTSNITMNVSGDYCYYNMTELENATVIDFRVYGNDTSGNLNASEWRRVTVNLTAKDWAPNVKIVYPTNGTIASSFIVNYTAVDDFLLDSCWLQNSTGNFSLANCSYNLTGPWPEGLSWQVVWANDSSGQTSFDSVWFTLDTVSPDITILSPLNYSYKTSTVQVNATSTDTNGVDSCLYSMDGGQNSSLERQGNFYLDDVKEFSANRGRGIEQNGTYIWVGHTTDGKVYEYWMNGTSTGRSYLGIGTFYRWGIVQNGTYFWMVDNLDTGVYNYWTNWSAVSNFDTGVSGNTDPRGITQNGTYIWVTDTSGNSVYIYLMNGTYTGTSFSLSSSGIESPMGITQNGTYMWIIGFSNHRVFRYWMNGSYTGTYSLLNVGNANPRDITQNGTYFWVSDSVSSSVFQYEMDDGTFDYNDDYYALSAELSEGSHEIVIYCNDTAGNLNSSVQYFTVDTVPPYYTNYSSNKTSTMMYGQTLNVTARWYDATTEMSKYVFSWNATGLWVNVSYGNLDANGWSTILTRVPNEAAGHDVGFMIYANDSSNNFNATAVSSFSVIAANITLSTDDFELNLSSGNLTFNYSGREVYWWNATPNNQTSTVGIFSIVSYDIVDINATLNETLPSCMTYKVGNVSNSDIGRSINTTYNYTIWDNVSSGTHYIWITIFMNWCRVGNTADMFNGSVVFWADVAV